MQLNEKERERNFRFYYCLLYCINAWNNSSAIKKIIASKNNTSSFATPSKYGNTKYNGNFVFFFVFILSANNNNFFHSNAMTTTENYEFVKYCEKIVVFLDCFLLINERQHNCNRLISSQRHDDSNACE